MNKISRIRGILLKYYSESVVGILRDDDDLREVMGVDSLQMVKIITEIEEEFQCDLSLIFICETKITIEVIVKYIVGRKKHGETWDI